MYVHCLRMLSASVSTHLKMTDSNNLGGGGIWCNPPYGKDIINWVRKASEEYKKPYCNFIVMLLPARTDTRWFQEYVYPYAYLWFIGGRLKFGGKNTSAPFPSMIAVFARRDK